MKVICLTGGLASGKTTVAQYLENKGAHVIDADKFGHRAYEPGTRGFCEVVAAFGSEIIGENGQINRTILGDTVFSNPAALKRLTDIVWPIIGDLIEADIAEYRRTNPDGVIVLEAAMLLEAGWENLGDEIWAIITDREVAIKRGMSRNGADRIAVENRLDAQLSNDHRIAKADIVIDNNLDQATLLIHVNSQWQRLTDS